MRYAALAPAAVLELSQSLPSLTSLTSLDLSFCIITRRDLQLLIGSLRCSEGLRALNLQASLIAVGQLLDIAPIVTEKLAYLNIAKNHINDDELLSFVQSPAALTGLKELILSDSSLSAAEDEKMMAYAKAAPNLRTIDLSRCKLNARTNSLTTFLQNCSRLKDLHIDGAYVFPEDTRSAHQQAVEQLPRVSHLIALNLGEVTAFTAMKAAAKLRNYPRLQLLQWSVLQPAWGKVIEAALRWQSANLQFTEI